MSKVELPFETRIRHVEKPRSLLDQLRELVRKHPYLAVAIAVLMGLAIGLRE